MGFEAIVVLLVLMAVFAALIYGCVSGKRSAVMIAISAAVAVLATIGAWYSWAESRSVPWAAGYGVMAVMALGYLVLPLRGGRC